MQHGLNSIHAQAALLGIWFNLYLFHHQPRHYLSQHAYFLQRLLRLMWVWHLWHPKIILASWLCPCHLSAFFQVGGSSFSEDLSQVLLFLSAKIFQFQVFLKRLSNNITWMIGTFLQLCHPFICDEDWFLFLFFIICAVPLGVGFFYNIQQVLGPGSWKYSKKVIPLRETVLHMFFIWKIFGNIRLSEGVSIQIFYRNLCIPWNILDSKLTILKEELFACQHLSQKR